MRPFLIASLLLGLSGVAQAANSAVGDTQSVAAAVEALNTALLAADGDALEALTAPGLSYGHSSGKLQDRAAFIAEVAGNAFDFVSIRTSDQSIHVAGSTAIVRHIFSASYVTNGAPGELKLGILQVWQKQQRKWKLLARQAYKL